MEQLSIALTNQEICYLGALLGASEFLGIEDTMFSWSEDEIKREWVKVQAQLENKQYIEVGFDGGITVDELVYAIIHTCCHCETYAVVNSLQKKRSMESHYYITKPLAVNMKPEENETGSFRFTILTTTDVIRQSLLESVSLTDAELFSTDCFVVTDGLMQEAKEKLNVPDDSAANQLIIEAGYNKDFATELIALMSTPHIFTSLVQMHFKEENRGTVSQLTFIKSEKFLWKIEPVLGEEVTYRFTPQRYEQAVSDIDSWFMPIVALYQYSEEEKTG